MVGVFPGYLSPQAFLCFSEEALSVGKWGRCRRRGGCRWRGKAKDRSVPFLSLCSWALNWGLGGGMPPGNEASTSTYITLTPHRHPTPARKPRAG